MGERLPFTKRERRRLCYQDGFGWRARNDWGAGNLPAPWAEGDIVELVDVDKTDGRLRGMEGPWFVVTAGFSIGEGDAWYFRVSDGSGGNLAGNSDRLHVFPDDIDYMAGFRLVDTPDPEGMAERERLLDEGWEPPSCVDRGCACDCHTEADDA